MLNTTSLLLAMGLAIFVMASASEVHANTPHLRRRQANHNNHLRSLNTTSVICLILQVHMQTSEGDEDHLECDLISEDEGIQIPGLQIKLPEELVENHQKELRRGEWYVRIFGASIEETFIEGHGTIRTSVTVPDGAEIISIPSEDGDMYADAMQGSRPSRYLQDDRTLAAKSSRRILVVRVYTSDRAPTYSKQQLYQYYFGNGYTDYSVAKQFNLCSSGWLTFRPVSAVIDVYVPGYAASFNQNTLLVPAMANLQAQLGLTSLTGVAEHISFNFPPGLSGNMWYGYATVGAYRTVFNDKYGGIPNTIMHEIGHNLGLNHAGVGQDEYDDESDLMGYGAFQQFGPSKCFNGKHLWDLGWFTDRTAVINPFTQPQMRALVQLACFVDYSKTLPGQYVAVNVGPFYLVYNQAKGVNSGTQDVPNMVTIVQPGTLSTYRVGAISNTTGPFQVQRYSNSAGTLIIKVCRIVTTAKGIQVAIVSIGINNGNCS